MLRVVFWFPFMPSLVILQVTGNECPEPGVSIPDAPLLSEEWTIEDSFRYYRTDLAFV